MRKPIVILLSALASAFAQSDTTPPELVSYTFTPSSVTASTGPAVINGTVRFTDNLSGVGHFYVQYHSPSGTPFYCAQVSSSPASGTLQNGAWSCSGQLAQHAQTGAWEINWVYVSDKSGNQRSWNKAQLQQLGILTTLNVTGVGDTTPPALLSYTFTPATANTSAGSVVINGSLRLTDDLSGVGHFYVEYRSPSGSSFYCGASSSTPASGTPQNGTWSCSGELAQYTESGAWVVSSIYAADKTGNYRVWTAAQLQPLGIQTSLTITGLGDTTPPALVGFSITPTSLSTSAGPGVIAGHLHLTDNLSGIGEFYVQFQSPSGAVFYCSPFSSDPESGTPQDGTFGCSGELAQYAETGAWVVQRLYVSDKAGNYRSWSMAQLQQLGVATAFTVMATGQASVHSFSPLTGTASSGTFTATYKHTGGATQHYLGYILLLPTPNVVSYVATGSCLVEYNRISNGVRLINDAGTGWLGGQSGIPISPSAAVLQNSQCSVDVSKTVAVVDSDTMTVAAPITLKPAFPGVLATFLQSLDVTGAWTGMTQFGNWTAPGVNTRVGPKTQALSPAIGSGNTALLNVTATHPHGAVSSLAMLHLLISDRIVGGTPCQIVYLPSTNTVNLINDAGTDMSGNWISPGAGLVTNGRCSLSGVGMARTLSNQDRTMVVTLPVYFNTASFGGLKNLYLNVFDNSGLLSHWVHGGVWTVQ